jgi:hypothetical protein
MACLDFVVQSLRKTRVLNRGELGFRACNQRLRLGKKKHNLIEGSRAQQAMDRNPWLGVVLGIIFGNLDCDKWFKSICVCFVSRILEEGGLWDCI